MGNLRHLRTLVALSRAFMSALSGVDGKGGGGGHGGKVRTGSGVGGGGVEVRFTYHTNFIVISKPYALHS